MKILTENIVEVLDGWFDSRVRDIHTMLPGQINSYDGHEKRTAQVKIMVKIHTRNGDTLDIPPIDNVPVIFPSCGLFSLLFPLNRGDSCLVLFSEEGIGGWINSEVEVDGDSLAKFALTDAICVPGLWSTKKVPKSGEQAEIEIESEDKINLKTKSGGVVTLDGTNLIIGTNPVPPTGLCQLPNCVFSGAPHTTNQMPNT